MVAVISLLISIIALVVAGVSAISAWRISYSNILSHFVQLERSLASVPKAFRFHGITDDEIAAAGVTAEELAYLVASFSCGNFYHRLLHPFDRSPFPPLHYRYSLCMSDHFKKAWPLVRRFISPSNFVTRVDKTIAQIETGGSP